MPPELGLAFDVALHLGTLAAIVTFFRTELAGMARSIPALFSADPGDAGRLMQLIAAGTIPIVIVGLLFTDFIEERLRTPAVAAVALAVGALAMMVAERLGPRSRIETSLRWSDALLI